MREMRRLDRLQGGTGHRGLETGGAFLRGGWVMQDENVGVRWRFAEVDNNV